MYTGFVQRGLPRSSPKNAAAPLYQESLGDDFARGASTDLWGRLMGTPYTKIPPEGTPVLERFWQAGWERGGEPTFEAIR